MISPFFTRLPDQIFSKEIKYIIPTILSFVNPSEIEENGVILFIHDICRNYKQNEYFVMPIDSEIDIVGDFIEYGVSHEDGLVTSFSNFNEKRMIGKVNVKDSITDIIKLFQKDQFEYIIGNGYLVFDKSLHWVLLESEDLNVTLFICFEGIPFEEAIKSIKPYYIIDKDYLIESFLFNFKKEQLVQFDSNYLNKCVFG